MKTKSFKRTRRLALCMKCQYAQELPMAGTTCGKPLVGNTVTHDGETVDLCGCVMAVKTMIRDAKCPIGKW